ncbi:MAG: hypothetical protein D4R66_06255 [Opitutales bacterium]|jgi:hypothetical protein|nr:MAG: hypothetical protein D4R66_06255 [Opitutales bacterium]
MLHFDPMTPESTPSPRPEKKAKKPLPAGAIKLSKGTLPGWIVYAVELQPFAELPIGKQRELQELNPQAKEKARVFYVGQSRHEAVDRYQNHRAGFNASAWVKRFGVRLIVLDRWVPALRGVRAQVVKDIFLIAQRNKGEPTARERRVTELLRSEGFFVYSK